MPASLVPCPSCARHVRATERACPFCQGALSSNLASRAVPGATQRLSRAAAFTFAASLAATGCSSDPAPNDAATTVDTGSDSGSVTADTGTPDSGARPDTGVSADAGVPTDDGGFLAMYGGPPQDAGADTGAPVDDGGVAPLYGLPALDAGQDGSIGVRYGSPPRPDAGA